MSLERTPLISNHNSDIFGVLRLRQSIPARRDAWLRSGWQNVRKWIKCRAERPAPPHRNLIGRFPKTKRAAV